MNNTPATEAEWYDYRAINSRNALWSIVAGPRSIGKTYGKKLARIKIGIESDGARQTLWVRRTLTELNPAKTGFFDSIAPLYPGFDFRVLGHEGQVQIDGKEWTTIFRFAPLSTSAQLKGSEFPNVDEIVYDECFAEPGMPYLPEELDRLRGLWVTVNRSRVALDERAVTKVVLLGNPHTLDNPYFLEFNLTGEREWQKFDGNNGILHMVDASKYKRRVTQSIYGNLLGTAMMDYAEGGYFLPDGGYIIDERPPDSKPFCTLVTMRGVFGLWLSPDFATMFCTVGPLAAQEAPVVSFEPMAVRPGVVYAEPKRFIRTEARRHYRRGSLYLVTPGAMAARQALAR